MNLFEAHVRELLHSEFPERRMSWHRVLDSTNLECRRLCESSPEARWVVFADEQTQGRGCQGRPWQSAAGVNLYFSASWINPFGSGVGHLNLFWGLLVWEAVNSLGNLGSRLTLKWPNDLYLGDRKLAGILLESLDEKLERMVVGIGLNVHSSWEQIPETGTSLREELGEGLNPEARTFLVRRLLEGMEGALARACFRDPGSILQKFWDRALLTRDADYPYHSGRESLRGRLRAIHADGTVEIETPDARRVHLLS